MSMETLHSRWSRAPKLDERGKVIPLDFGEYDLDICRILTPRARDPWGYQYLPTSYIATLLGRSYGSVRNRLSKLHREPYAYIKLPDQPKNNYRERIFAIDKNGIDELREAGVDAPVPRLRALTHELMACIIAASFEYGARKHKLTLERVKTPDVGFFPDWPLFALGGMTVWLEADTGSETIHYNEQATTIAGKFENYLKLIGHREFKKSVAVFVTARESRMNSMIRVLQDTIEKNGYPNGYADHFVFTHIEYSRYVNTIPKLTDWAVKTKYATAFEDETFSFLK